MSIQDRERWEQRHERAQALSARPSVLALEPAPRNGALALDLACGQGRHSRALAAKGYLVVAMDVSIRALVHATGNHTAASIAPLQADADAWPFLPESFDLIVQTDFLDRSLFPVLRDALRPGGLLLLDTFADGGQPNEEGPSNPAFLLRPGELPQAFSDLEMIRYQETAAPTARGTMLARKR